MFSGFLILKVRNRWTRSLLKLPLKKHGMLYDRFAGTESHLADKAMDLDVKVVDVLGPMLRAIEGNWGLLPKNQAGLGACFGP
jgi:hypothetical protein